MPKGHDAAPEPVEEKLPPNVVMPKPGERKFASIAELNKTTQAEKSAAEMRLRGEGATGEAERTVLEAQAQIAREAQAANTGFMSRIKSFGNKVLEGVGGFFKFLKSDIVNLIVDAGSDFLSRRKEDGEATTQAVLEIDAIERQLNNPKITAEDRATFEASLRRAQDHLFMLRDPHNWERKNAKEAAETQKREQAEAKEALKGEAPVILPDEAAVAAREKAEADEHFKNEALREKSEAEAKLVEFKKTQAEQAEQLRQKRISMGQKALTVIGTAGEVDLADIKITEAEAAAVGTVIDLAIKGVRAAVAAPEKIRKAREDAKNGLKADLENADFLISGAIRGVVLYDDLAEMYNNLNDPFERQQKVVGAQLSYIGAILKNTDIQDEVARILEIDQEQVLTAGDEEGDGTSEVEKPRAALIRKMKEGYTSKKDRITDAVGKTWEAVRDSKAMATAKTRGTQAAKGVGYVALGAGAVVTSPVLVPFAAGYYGAMAAGKAHETVGTIGDIYADLKNAPRENGNLAQSETARVRLQELSPQLAETLLSVLQAGANLDNAPADMKKEALQAGRDLLKSAEATAHSIGENVGKVVSFGERAARIIGKIGSAAMVEIRKIEAEAIDEAAKAKNPEVAANTQAAINALEQAENAS